MTADLSALIARLEAAEVGSRELDREIWYSLEFDSRGEPSHAPKYSESLDAALALASRLELHADRLLFEVLEAGEFKSDRLALALVIAILRAKQGEGE